MVQEKEQQRHQKVLEQIRNAKTKEEIPNSTLSKITQYLANNVYFDDIRLKSTDFKPVLEAVLKYNFFMMPEVKEAFVNVLKKNYPDKTEDEYNAQFEKINNTSNISNYIIEAGERNAKLDELEREANLQMHKEIMKQIKNSFEIKDLPKVGKGVLNRKIKRAMQNDYIDKLPIDIINQISDYLLQGKSKEEIYEIIYAFCKEVISDSNLVEEMYQQLESGLFVDETIGYTVEEIQEKEKRVLEIYKEEHEETMENIKDARRISQLPQNLTFSTLAGYLSGNSIIYPKGPKISTTDLKNLTRLLLEGNAFSSLLVSGELKQITQKYYPENSEEAYELLLNKLSSLPRLGYLIEEINYSQKRQTEFIGRNSSNVNVYFVPNPKTPVDGGRFYNCYINRVENLDLGQILPLDLEEIIPDEMDVDSIEWYVQEHYDETFKIAGGIILNKDETIGNVNVFKPSDGRIGITPEEHTKYKELEELGIQVKELIKQKKANSERFKAAQDAFFKYEEASDKKLAELEAKINLMLRNDSEEKHKTENEDNEER